MSKFVWVPPLLGVALAQSAHSNAEANVAPDMIWKDWVVHTCESGLHFFPGTPLEANSNIGAINDAIKSFLDIYEDNAGCVGCDVDYYEQWKERFVRPSIDMLAYGLLNPNAKDSFERFRDGCPMIEPGPAEFFVSDENFDEEFKRGLSGSGCTWDRWDQGLGCTHQRRISGDITFEIHVNKCDNGQPLPYFHVQCQGQGCVNIGAPCSVCHASDSTCDAARDTIPCANSLHTCETLNNIVDVDNV
jgi:hypothetical protein